MRRTLVAFGAAIVCCHSPERVEALPASLSAPAVLSRMASVYATAAAYTDRGSVRDDDLRSRLLWTILRGPSYDTFTTSFKRDGSTSFAYHQSYRRDHTVSGRVDDPQFSGELVALRGVTRGASDLVLQLLAPRSGEWSITALSEPGLRPPIHIRNHTCYVVAGARGPTHYRLSVDSVTYELIRVHVDWDMTRSSSTIDYWPNLTK